jgi:hypothetical protein
MKENELNKILKKPVMDETMDQKIANSILLFSTRQSKNFFAAEWKRMWYFISQKVMYHGISRMAIAFLALVILGTGTALAAGMYVKSFPTEVNFITKDMIDYEDIYKRIPINEVRKNFGQGNKMIGLLRDINGNILAIDEDGYYTFEDGSKFLAPYVPNPERHKIDRISGDEAFAETSFPNLVPSIIYDDYLLYEGGFKYYKATYEDDTTFQSIHGEFFPEYTKTDNFSEAIYFWFTPVNSPEDNPGVLYLLDEKKDLSKYIQSSYTNQGGIICTLLKSEDGNNVIAHSAFEGNTMGNGNIMIEFVNFKQMNKIEKILDSLPITSDTVTTEDY